MSQNCHSRDEGLLLVQVSQFDAYVSEAQSIDDEE